MSRFIEPHTAKRSREYAPSFFTGEFLNETQAELVERLEDVRGKLHPADHYKLYEAGYFARGPILEVGRLLARSTICLALGVRDSGSEVPIVSIEIVDKYLEPARRNLTRHGVLDNVVLVQGDSGEKIPTLGYTFDTVFIDGKHTYEGTRADIVGLEGRIGAGGVVMFHDYFHPANDDGRFGVRQAVTEHGKGLEFRGRFGGLALFEQT